MKTDTIINVALLGVAVLALTRLNKWHSAGSDLLKPVADGISNIINKIRFAGEGIQATQAGVVLRREYFTNDAINQGRLQAISAMHPDNPQILQFALTAGGQLKEPYRSMLNQSEILLIKPDGTTESI